MEVKVLEVFALLCWAGILRVDDSVNQKKEAQRYRKKSCMEAKISARHEHRYGKGVAHKRRRRLNENIIIQPCVAWCARVYKVRERQFADMPKSPLKRACRHQACLGEIKQQIVASSSNRRRFGAGRSGRRCVRRRDNEAEDDGEQCNSRA